MKISSILPLAFLSGALTLAVDVEKRQTGTLYAHLTFHAGPASYALTVPNDGTRVPTSKPFPHATLTPLTQISDSNLNVNIIDIPDYYPNYCQFETAGEKTLVTSINTKTGLQSLLVGPPQPIIAVTCQGYCIYTYGDCYRNGQFLGICCAGFCAANKCRPWIAPGSN